MNFDWKSLFSGGGVGAVVVGALFWLFSSSAFDAGASALVTKVCSATDAERIVLQERVDRITSPHMVRVTCANLTE